MRPEKYRFGEKRRVGGGEIESFCELRFSECNERANT
jgi:hypothetical protein